MTLVTFNNQTGKSKLGLTPFFNEVFGEFVNGGTTLSNFGEFVNGGTTLSNYYNKQVAVNVIETETGYSLEFAAPGFEKTDFNVNWENNVLTVSATKTQNETETEKNYTKREFYFTTFERTFTLPENINVEGIWAEYKNGILNVTLPKTEVVKTTGKTINIL